MRWCHRGVGR